MSSSRADSAVAGGRPRARPTASARSVLRGRLPVLTAGPPPQVDTASWSFRVDGVVGAARSWSWESLQAPAEEVPCDIHCVTKWSKLDTSFRGVSVDTLLADAEPLGDYAMAFSYGGYTTNLPLEDLTDGKAWVVTEWEGEPLPTEHGGPRAC